MSELKQTRTEIMCEHCLATLKSPCVLSLCPGLRAATVPERGGQCVRAEGGGRGRGPGGPGDDAQDVGQPENL